MLPIKNVGLYRAFGIALCLTCMEAIPALKKPFTLKIFRFLGKISAYVYIFHWPIILSLGCGLYLLLQDVPYELAVSLITVAVVAVSCGVGFLYGNLQPIIIRGENTLAEFFGRKLKKKTEG